MKELSVVISHRIPGRIRLRLLKAPRDASKFISQVRRHEGVNEITYTPITKSLLIYYNPSVVSSTEIIVRVGIAFSLEYGNNPVNIVKIERRHKLTPLDYYAATSLLVATLSKLLDFYTPGSAMQNSGNDVKRILSYNAGISTLLSVLNHAWREVKREGIYDPEVISVVYLFNSMVKGNFLGASLITWGATFGRHLAHPIEEHCLLEANEVIDDKNRPYVDVRVRPISDEELVRNPIKFFVAGLSRLVGTTSSKGHQTIFEQVQQMSRKHGNVLEGISRKPMPVYMRLESLKEI